MRLHSLAIAVLVIIVTGQAAAAPAGQQQYIVKTKHVITQPHAKAAPSVQDVVRSGGGHVDFEWRDRLVVTLPDTAVQFLMQHPAVEFVQKVASGIPEGGTVAAENADPVVTSSAFRPAPKSLPPWTSGTYSYDGEGNITAIGSNAYSYDAFSRLATSTTNGIPETYTYDRYGNLTQKVTGTGSTALTVQSSVDDGNHLSGHCYDTAGNLTDDTDPVRCPTATETHSFDALNMMTMKWNRSAGTKEYYIYNANNERIAVIPCSGTVCTEQITFSFRDESGKVLRQFEVPYQQFDSPWTWVEDYVYRDGTLFAAERMPAQGGRRHFHVDHLGTPRLITDNTGHRLSEHDYFPFGVEATPLRQDTVPPNNFNREEPMKFTGHERDFTVGTAAENSNYIDYMHARSTVPQWGRFLSVDPVLGNPKVPQTWNRYAYVGNNPIGRSDPTGREFQLTECVHGRGQQCGEQWALIRHSFGNKWPAAGKYLHLGMDGNLSLDGIGAKEFGKQFGVAARALAMEIESKDTYKLWTIQTDVGGGAFTSPGGLNINVATNLFPKDIGGIKGMSAAEAFVHELGHSVSITMFPGFAAGIGSISSTDLPFQEAYASNFESRWRAQVLGLGPRPAYHDYHDYTYLPKRPLFPDPDGEQ